MEYLSNVYFWMWMVVIFIQTVVTFSAIGTCFKPRKSTVQFSIFGASVCVAVLFMLIVFVGEYPLVKVCAMIILPAVCALFFTSGDLVRKGIFYILCLTIDYFLEVGIYFIMEVSGMGSEVNVGEFTLNRVVMTVFSLMFQIPLKYSTAKMWCRFINKEEGKLGGVFLIFPICQIVVYYILIYENTHAEIGQEYTLALMLAAFTVLSAANVVYLHYISDIEQNSRLMLQLRDMEYAHKLEAEHYTRIEEKRYELAKIRHDFRNELSAVKKLISTGSSETARELIDNLEKSLDNTAESRYCSVPVIDAVVSEKEELIAQNGIRFEHSISVDGADNVQPVHLCSIFANLLDNAVKANLEVENDDERYISLASFIKGGTITVRCENPVNGDSVIPMPAQSTGYGLKILNDIASKYDGRFSVSADNGICTAVITLNLMC